MLLLKWRIARTLGATLAWLPRLGMIGVRGLPNIAFETHRSFVSWESLPHMWDFERAAWRCAVCPRVAKTHAMLESGVFPQHTQPRTCARFQGCPESGEHSTAQHQSASAFEVSLSRLVRAPSGRQMQVVALVVQVAADSEIVCCVHPEDECYAPRSCATSCLFFTIVKDRHELALRWIMSASFILV